MVTPEKFEQKLLVHTVQGLKLRMQLIREYRPFAETKGQLVGRRDFHGRMLTIRIGELRFFLTIVHCWDAHAAYGTRVSKCNCLCFSFVSF